jgi:N-acetylmuramoyl-L-alanine amidase
MQGMKGMKGERVIHQKNLPEKTERAGRTSLRSILFMSVAALLALTLMISTRAMVTSQGEVYAAAEDATAEIEAVEESDVEGLPTGIAGVVSGMVNNCGHNGTVKRIGTSCENVVVGQRISRIESSTAEMNVSDSMAATVEKLDEKAVSLASSAELMSDTDYETLLKIVEAEAGTEDVKGRIMVANVIMNRVKDDEFPDSVTEVVWDYSNGVPQFSPVYDGTINTVTVSDETKEAVRQVLEGVDYSEGALFFIQKSAAETQNISWFEKNLKKLFKHGVHEFYTYPDDV